MIFLNSHLPINEAHVGSYESQDRFLDEHDKGADKIDRNQRLCSNPTFIGLRVQSPSLRLIPKTLGLDLQNPSARSLGDQDKSNAPEKRSHDESDPCCPSPAEMRLRDKPADNGARNRTSKSTGGKDTDGVGSLDWTPDICKSAPNDS